MEYCGDGLDDRLHVGRSQCGVDVEGGGGIGEAVLALEVFPDPRALLLFRLRRLHVLIIKLE